MPTNPETDQDPATATGADILQAVGSTRTTIDWQRSAPWWFFLSGFVRLGWRLSHVAMGTIGVFLSYLGVHLVGKFFFDTNSSFMDRLPQLNESPALMNVLSDFNLFSSPSKFSATSAAGIVTLFFWLAAVWGLFGGLICRRSVVEMGARTTIGWTSSLRLVLKRWRAMLESAGLPAVAAGGLCMMPFVLGLFGRLGTWAEYISMVGILVTFLAAIPIAWLLLLSTLGYPFMVASIVTERESDAFDGLSRSAAYLFQRPVTIILAMLIAGSIISFLTSIIGGAYTISTNIFSSVYLAGAGLNDTSELATSLGKNVFNLMSIIFALMIVGLAASLSWSAVAATYLLVRREVDHTDYDELDLQEIGCPLALPSSDYEDNRLLKKEGEKHEHQPGNPSQTIALPIEPTPPNATSSVEVSNEGSTADPTKQSAQ